ncbi:TPA: hypothetical protein DCG86_09185 [Candidatus Marinimicrobia bacterium]|nr:MAG: hypothetical protein XD77_0867 [Marinimicrobia bacterium 46_47]HAE88180.1 hypothetical protein [Candidatus Neomarinimicrobiota bacterium]
MMAQEYFEKHLREFYVFLEEHDLTEYYFSAYVDDKGSYPFDNFTKVWHPAKWISSAFSWTEYPCRNSDVGAKLFGSGTPKDADLAHKRFREWDYYNVKWQERMLDMPDIPIFEKFDRYEYDRNLEHRLGIKSGILYGYQPESVVVFPLAYISRPRNMSEKDFRWVLDNIKIEVAEKSPVMYKRILPDPSVHKTENVDSTPLDGSEEGMSDVDRTPAKTRSWTLPPKEVRDGDE